jgi:NAD(P)-dependent dehydrogenase (short-subunit alcohol dehydrogenase family)
VAQEKKPSGADSDRVALIMGANRGIGFEIARQLARRGLRVVLGAREANEGKRAATKLAPEGPVVAETIDVADAASVQRAIGAIRERFGRIDVLVNNAGVLVDSGQTASGVSLGDVQKTLDVNLIGAWRVSQAVLPLMHKQRYGRIVNVSSSMGTLSDAAGSGGGWPAYRLSKTALNALTILLAAELRGQNVLVNAVSPGWVRTRMGGDGAPRSVEEGADTPVWLATLPDGGPSGQLFLDRKRIDW